MKSSKMKSLIWILVFINLVNASTFDSFVSANLIYTKKVRSNGTIIIPPDPTPTPNKDDLLWATNFEDGMAEWDKLPSYYLYKHPPQATLTVERFDERYWCKSEIVDPNYPSDYNTDIKCRAEVALWGRTDFEKNFVSTKRNIYYGALLYLPEDFHVTRGAGSWSSGCSLVQLHEGVSLGWAGGIYVNLNNQKLRFNFNKYDYGKRSWVHTTHAEFEPIKGRAVPFIIHVDASQNGKLEFWYDGKKLVEVKGDFRTCPDAQNKGWISRGFKLGIYCGYKQNRKKIFFTNIAIGEDFDTVQAWVTS